MQLIWATSDFIIGGRPYPGFPIVLHDSMESAVEANQFLRSYLTRGVIASERSWPNTGRAIYDYFGFLEAHGLDWRDVERGEEKALVAAYRDYSLKEVKLSRNTVRQRLHYVCEFYKYALKEGWVDRLPYSEEDREVRRTDKGYLAHVNASGNRQVVRDVMPRHHKNLPKFLSKDQVKALLGATTNPHHLMITRFTLQTGLRRDEIATFPLAYVFHPDAKPGQANAVRVTLNPSDGSGMRTKGSKEREIVISRRFMTKLYRYSILQRGELASNNGRPQSTLFLTRDGLPYQNHGKSIETFVRANAAKVGIKSHPHMLRHTYATHTLFAAQRNPAAFGLNPLVFLQRQLGHASIATTMIYLHLVNELVDDAVLAYDDELNDWLEVN
ncbi:MAG: integrase [Lysobacteraceae bacterium]|nr:MAG: integrase [Xanthomonadaceae bacterium]